MQTHVKQSYQLTSDPIFYVTVGFFAMLTTALPGLMGQPNFMPIVQALGLTVFTAIALRRAEIDNALRVVAIWLLIQWIVMLLIAWIVPIQAERAIHAGFAYRADLFQWFYTGDAHPGTLRSEPGSALGEVAGILLGSLATGGLVGSWFLTRAVNLFAFAVGSLTLGVEAAGLGLLAGLAPWRVLTLAGYAGFFVLLAQPILVNRWSPAYYWTEQRRLVLWSAGLLAAGLISSFVLPSVWQAIFGG